MKILCIDTSSKFCNVAILENTKLIEKTQLNNGLTHSESLMPEINEILSKNNLKLKNIDLIVVDVGPGSFTGLRIGIATAKAFHDSLNIPTIGISSLDILAYNIKENGLICSTIDCKNDNCYFALYELINDDLKLIEEPQAESIQYVTNLLKNKYSNKKINFVGDGIKDIKSNNYLDVENLGILGYKKYINNNKKSEEILPMYLKKSQAERLLENKN